MSESIIRPLAPSEVHFALVGHYSGFATRVLGPLHTAALSAAVRALGRTYPVLPSGIGADPAGMPALTTGSVALLEFSQAEGYSDDRLFQLPELDGRVGAVHVVRHDAATWSLTLLTQHAMADSHHLLEVLADLWSFYTEAAAGRELRPTSQGLPRPLEDCLFERHIATSAAAAGADAAEAQEPPEQQRLTACIEPVDAVGNPVWRRAVFTVAETNTLVAVARRAQTTVNGVVSAALMLATAEDTGIPVEDLLKVYAVDYRQRVAPPISPTEVTNGCLAEVFSAATPGTDVLTLARAITDTLEHDMRTGRLLGHIGLTHTLVQVFMASAGRIIFSSNRGIVPRLARPADHRLIDFHSLEHFTNPDGGHLPLFLVSTFEGELRADATYPEKVLDSFDRFIRELIRGRDGAATDQRPRAGADAAGR